MPSILPSSRPTLDSLISAYLLSSGFTATYNTFVQEASLPSHTEADVEVPSSFAIGNDVDLRTIVDEFYVNIDRLKEEEKGNVKVEEIRKMEDQVLKMTLPEKNVPKRVVRTLSSIHAANILTVVAHNIPRRTFNTSTASYESSIQKCLLTTSSDKTLKVTHFESGEVISIHSPHPTAATLSVTPHPHHPSVVLTTSMDSTLALSSLSSSAANEEPLQIFRGGHTKFVTSAVFLHDGKWVVSIGRDCRVCFWLDENWSSPAPAPESEKEEEEEERYHEEVEYKPKFVLKRTIDTRSPPTCLFASSRSQEGEYILWACREDNWLYYLPLEGIIGGMEEDAYHGGIKKLNLNENGDGHVSFSVLDIKSHPSPLLPIISLLLVPLQPNSTSRIILLSTHLLSTPSSAQEPPFSNRRLATLYTGQQTDEYSLPLHCWLPSGRGVVLIPGGAGGEVRTIDLQGRIRGVVGQVHGGDGRGDVVKDVCVVGEEVVTCGFDWTVRVLAA